MYKHTERRHRHGQRKKLCKCSYDTPCKNPSSWSYLKKALISTSWAAKKSFQDRFEILHWRPIKNCDWIISFESNSSLLIRPPWRLPSRVSLWSWNCLASRILSKVRFGQDLNYGNMCKTILNILFVCVVFEKMYVSTTIRILNTVREITTM